MSNNYVEDSKQKQLTGVGIVVTLASVVFPALIPIAAGVWVGKAGRKYKTVMRGPSGVDILANQAHAEAYLGSLRNGASIIETQLARMSQPRVDSIGEIRIRDHAHRNLIGSLTGEHTASVEVYHE